jgi:hypothetical protein
MVVVLVRQDLNRSGSTFEQNAELLQHLLTIEDKPSAPVAAIAARKLKTNSREVADDPVSTSTRCSPEPNK